MIKIWIQAIRPKTLIASIAPVLIGSTLAFKTNTFDYFTFLFTLLAALTVQVGTNFTNDYYDCLKGADTNERKGPTRVMQAKLVTIPQMRVAIISIFCLTALCTLYLTTKGGLLIALLALISIACGIFYTAGPLPLAYLGLGELFVLIFFGPIAVATTDYLQTHLWNPTLFYLGFAPGFLSCSILIVNNLRDIPEDRKANKKTLAVRFGATFAKYEYIASIILAALLPLFFLSFPYSLIPALILIPALPLIKQVLTFTDPRSLNAVLAKTGKLLFFQALLILTALFLTH